MDQTTPFPCTVIKIAQVVHVVAAASAAVFVFRGGVAAGRRARHRAWLCVYTIYGDLWHVYLDFFFFMRWGRGPRQEATGGSHRPTPRLRGGDRENRSGRGPPGGAGLNRM